MKRFKLLSFLMFNAALSLEGRALAADTSIDPPTNQSQQSEGQLLSCALLIKSKDMPKAFRVQDEINLPIIGSDGSRSRQLEAAYSDVIDAFSGKPNLEVYVNRESTDHFSFVINLSGHFRGMQINSNYKEQGVSGRIDTNDEDIWMTHRDILDGSFQALTIRISNAGSPESDKRESVYAVCALGD